MDELAFLREALDQAAVGLVLTDPQLRIVYANQASGRREGDVLGSGEPDMTPVRDASGAVVGFAAVLAAMAAQRRSSFLADASSLLDATLDHRVTLESLTRLSLPFLGDVCIVDEIHGDEVIRLAAAATDPEIEAQIRTQPSPRRAHPDDPLVRVVLSGRPEIVADFEPLAAAMIVPLKARGTTIGAVVFGSLNPEREYGSDDLVVAADLAHRAALALDNARLYENLGAIAKTLQEGLLPQRLPVVSGIDIAARYRPAGDGSLIGGDFYDVLRHERGVDLVIGDVTGKGARAAALTAQVRHTLRTAARYEPTPSRVLDVLNSTLIAERTDTGRYCTVAFCRLETNGSPRATICCAGHPMPMVVRDSGTIEHVGRPGSVLGWVPDPKLLDVEFDLADREALVLFTDGVTEARTTGDAYGLAGLEELLRAAAGEDAAGIATRIDRAAAFVGARRDDVAVLVARRCDGPGRKP